MSLWILQSWMHVKLSANLMCLSKRSANIYYKKFCLTFDEYGFSCSIHKGSMCAKAIRFMVNAVLKKLVLAKSHGKCILQPAAKMLNRECG